MISDVKSNYRIEGLNILLNEDCVLTRYFPLIPYKAQLIDGLLQKGCLTKNDCSALSDQALTEAGLPGNNLAGLFRRFLRLYDDRGRGVKDIPEAESKTEEEIASLLELMRLPGVKAIRAELYYRCGLRSLSDFAASEAVQLREHIGETIRQGALPFSPPLLKELRTQIAVATVFTKYAAE